MKETKNIDNYDGLSVVKKTFNGVNIGYVVGWWFFPRNCRWDRGSSRQSFRSFRNGVIFKTKSKAVEFRDGVEKQRENSGVSFEAILD